MDPFYKLILLSFRSFPKKYRKSYLLRIFFQITMNFLDISAILLIAISLSSKTTSNYIEADSQLRGILTPFNNISVLIGICCSIFIFKGSISLILLNSNTSFLVKIASDASLRDFEELQMSSVEELENLDKSAVTRKFLRGYEDVFLILYSAIPILISELVLICFGFIVILGFISFKSNLLFLVLFSLLILLYKKFSRDSESTGRAYAQAANSMMNALSEQMNMFREYRLQGAENFVKSRFGKYFREMTLAKGKYLTILASPKYLLEIILFSFILFMLIVQEIFLTGFQSKSLGIFLAVGIRLLPSLLRLNNSISQIRSTYSSNSEIINFKNHHTTFEKSEKEAELKISYSMSKIDSKLIKVSDASFQHVTSNKPIIYPNLEILKGESVALVGKSGSGKSTLLDMICGFLEPSSGSVEIGGISAPKFVALNPRKIALIPQTNYIVEGDLIENIALFDVKPNRERVLELANTLNLDNLLVGDSRNFMTNSNQLSGGQKQRICIARALYFQPQILIFDEATAALDEENSNVVLDLIFKIKRDMTIIFSSHNMSHVTRFDRIISLD